MRFSRGRVVLKDMIELFRAGGHYSVDAALFLLRASSDAPEALVLLKS